MNSRMVTAIVRSASALILLPIYAYFLISDRFLGMAVLVVSVVVSLACLYEFYMMVRLRGRGDPFVIPGLIAGFFISCLMYVYAFGRVYGYARYIDLFNIVPFLALIALLLLFIGVAQILFRPINNAIDSLSSTVFGLLLIVVPYSHIILMRALPDGVFYIFVLHAVIMCNDTFAYFGGLLFGRHRIDLDVSPNKTWEGYFSGALFSIISIMVTLEVISIFFNRRLFEMWEAILLGLFLSLLGNLGDLLESAVKRDAEVKDSGTIIPGHGGMWDVFDALIFSFPFFYYYLKLKGI